jgi:hypothetical protein
MNDLIIEASIKAALAVTHPRFFRTERGYHGRYYCALMRAFDELHLLDDEDRIIEIEYQKHAMHGFYQRPDIIFHIPAEVTGNPRWHDNFAVWALKRNASAAEARSDFKKLDQMFDELNYPLGFFVNIDSDTDRLENYEGQFANRLYGIWVRLDAHGALQHGWRHCQDVVH